MSHDEFDHANSKQPNVAPHYIWQYFATTNQADAQKSTAKIAVCM